MTSKPPAAGSPTAATAPAGSASSGSAWEAASRCSWLLLRRPRRWRPRSGSTSSWPAWASRCRRLCCWPSSSACGGIRRRPCGWRGAGARPWACPDANQPGNNRDAGHHGAPASLSSWLLRLDLGSERAPCGRREREEARRRNDLGNGFRCRNPLASR